MNQKIEWYKEVLEIEPNSKIFFPLARMLAKSERPDEAIAVLRQGVGRHPDHIEARLFLVELLYSSGKVFELQQEIDVLSGLFKNYPGFWRAWGEHLFDEESTRDAGLAAIFLAAFLQNLPVSWAGIIEHGLKTLVGGQSQQPFSHRTGKHPIATPPPPIVNESASATPNRNFAAMMTVPNVPPQESAPLAASSPVSFGNTEDDGDDEVEEPITLRTRSMAEVLAEQGDIAGALDIYNELILYADSDVVQKDLQARINVLSGTQVQANNSDAHAAQEEKKDWLAVLAQRLEARSLQ